MKIAVTDANIFIDLIKLQWLGYLFNIALEIYTSREIIDELNPGQLEWVTAFIQSGQLQVYHFQANELEEILNISAPAALTIEDRSVVYLAKKMQCGVLTGDNPLRKFCEKEMLTVKGIIWLFDQFLDQGLVSFETAIGRMELLMSFNNRLPADHCNARLKAWTGKIK